MNALIILTYCYYTRLTHHFQPASALRPCSDPKEKTPGGVFDVHPNNMTVGNRLAKWRTEERLFPPFACFSLQPQTVVPLFHAQPAKKAMLPAINAPMVRLILRLFRFGSNSGVPVRHSISTVREYRRILTPNRFGQRDAATAVYCKKPARLLPDGPTTRCHHIRIPRKHKPAHAAGRFKRRSAVICPQSGRPRRR